MARTKHLLEREVPDQDKIARNQDKIARDQDKIAREQVHEQAHEIEEVSPALLKKSSSQSIPR